jgi:hypothetical protein
VKPLQKRLRFQPSLRLSQVPPLFQRLFMLKGEERERRV